MSGGELRPDLAMSRETFPPAPRPGADAAELRRHELMLSGRIQEMLLFGRPPEPGPRFEVGVFARPAEHVGGDFFEFFRYGPHVHDVVIGDVMGKGFPAALVGAALKAQILRHSRGQRVGEEARPEGRPAWIMQQVHQGVVPELMQLGYFSTLCYARFDLARRVLSLVDCGQPTLLHYRQQEDVVVQLAKPTGSGVNMPLGIVSESNYRDMEVAVGAGDLVLLYSDGLTEALGARSDVRGRRVLIELLRELRTLPAAELARALGEQALATLGSQEMPDDVTCLAVRIGKGGGGL